MNPLNPYKIALLAIYASSLIVTIAMVGKERKPITPANAIISLITVAGLATLVVLS